MRNESQVYLNFFSKNWLRIALPGVLLPALTYLSLASEPAKFSRSFSLETGQGSPSLERVVLADQLVSTLRSEGVKQELRLDDKSIVYKSGPYLVSIELIGSNDLEASQKILTFSQENFKAIRVGSEVTSLKSPKLFLPLTVATGAGILLGIILSLIRLYLKNF